MAEYWKSAPKVWCKQCKIYIRDTAFEKTQHEATGKHQGNLKRFLRDIHRDNERQQRDSQRAKSEVERLRQSVAGGATSGDNPPWKMGSAAASTTAAPSSQRPVSAEERKKQMAQLAEMGIAIPEVYRGEMALAGDWQTVSEKVISSGEGEEGGKEKEPTTLGVRKRKHDREMDEEEEEAKREAERFVSKGWGSRTRRYPGAKDEENLEDLDALLASTKEVKKTTDSGTGEDTTAEANPQKEDQPGETAPVKEEEPLAASEGVVFKKRRPKAMKK
ncbi:hypothetical protein BJX76DRAFT_339939 [Aspergillus varians]